MRTELSKSGEGDAVISETCFILTFYWNPWPAWMPYFLASCAQNPKVHWRIFTDADASIKTPPNVFIHKLSKERLEELASRKLGVAFKVHHGYKLCDLKPAYGDIFSEYLVGYRFWGYTDLDVIYGNIEKFLPRPILDNFDVVTAHDKILVGHFTLLRNTEKLRVLYKECPDIPHTMLSYECAQFDEKGFQELVKAKARTGELRLFQKSIQMNDCHIWWSGRTRFLILWHRGEVTDFFSCRRLCYFHFMHSKYRPTFKISPLGASGFFYIDHYGIHPIRGIADHIRFYVSFISTFFWTIPWYIRQSLKKILPVTLRDRLKMVLTKRLK